MAEVTAQGYSLKPQNEWFEEERDLYLAIDPNWSLEPSTPDGLKCAHDAEVFSALDETLQQAYNSKDPNKAVGVDLDIICALTGTERSEGSASTVMLTITGVPGTSVPARWRAESIQNGSRWAIDQAVVLTGGTATVQASCTQIGPTEASIGVITRIVDVVGGVTGVTNAAPAIVGTKEQQDPSLRVERAASVGRPGNNQVDSTIGEIFAVPGVRRVKAYENDTGSAAVDPVENPHGLPANSMSYVVDGGADPDVAMAIYLKKNPGCALNSVGVPVSVTVTSPKYPENKKLVKFGRPDPISMVLAITLKDDGTLPTQSVLQEEIRDAFMEFAAGDLVPDDVGFKILGFDIGEDVPFSTMYTPINKVIGAYGNSYVQSMTLNGGTTNISVAFDEISVWTRSNITVTVV